MANEKVEIKEETDAEKIDRLTKQVESMSKQKMSDDKTISDLRSKVDSELPQIVNEKQAQINVYESLVKSMLATFTGNAAFLKAVQSEALKLCLTDAKFRSLVKSALDALGE